MKRRSQVPKYIKRVKPKIPGDGCEQKPMNFRKRDARKPRPATNKGRHIRGGYWGK